MTMKKAKSLWVVLLAAVMLISGCGTNPDVEVTDSNPSPAPGSLNIWPKDSRRDDVFVGSQRCAECHQDIYDEYFGQHPMGRSTRQIEASQQESKYASTGKFQAEGCTYSVNSDSAGVLQHSESLADSNGEIYRQVVEMEFAIGSGERGFTFGFNRDGYLYQSPLTWYSQKDKWDLSPGYQAEGHPGFTRQISSDCIFCHTGQPNRHPEEDDRFRTPVLIEASIGCERCHGPGEEHCQIRSGQTKSNEQDSIVNPAKLPHARRDSVCYQCHLHGVDRILRAGRSSYDFRPGDLISDIWVAFVSEPPKGHSQTQFEAVSQSEQMVSSQCYLQSEGKLGCSSCHSAHSKPAPNQRIPFYRKRCLECHGPHETECSMPRQSRLIESAEDSCIQCHMPQASASDVPHTAQTDHRVLRIYAPDSPQALTEAELSLFEPRLFPIPEIESQRAMGLHIEKSVRSKSAANHALALLKNSRVNGKDVEATIAIAWLLLRLGDNQAALQAAQEAVHLAPRNSSAIEALALGLEANGDTAGALRMLGQIAPKSKWSVPLLEQRARLLKKSGMRSKAIEVLKQASTIQPSNVTLRKQLIRLLKEDSRPDDAKLESAQVERIRSQKGLR